MRIGLCQRRSGGGNDQLELADKDDDDPGGGQKPPNAGQHPPLTYCSGGGRPRKTTTIKSMPSERTPKATLGHHGGKRSRNSRRVAPIPRKSAGSPTRGRAKKGGSITARRRQGGRALQAKPERLQAQTRTMSEESRSSIRRKNTRFTALGIPDREEPKVHDSNQRERKFRSSPGQLGERQSRYDRALPLRRQAPSDR